MEKQNNSRIERSGSFLFAFALLCILTFDSVAETPDRFVVVGDREIPVVEQVDLLVVGGDTSSVIAAVEASRSGAKTLLVTPHPYLGDDLAGTLRLWIDPAERDALTDPLLRTLYNDPVPNRPIQTAADLIDNPNKIKFEYKILEAIDPKHPEAKPDRTPRLCDGLAEKAESESLQINGDATIIVDLKQEQNVGALALLAFYSKRNFEIASVDVYTGKDSENWKKIVENVKPRPPVPGASQDMVFKLPFGKSEQARYLKVVAKKQADASRILLGELLVFPDKKDLDILGVNSPKSPDCPILVRPMHVKRFLDKALIDNGVKFYYGTYLSGCLEDPDHPDVVCALISNRAGRQAVLAKRIVQAGEFDDDPKRDSVHKPSVPFVVIGGEPQEISSKDFPLLKNAKTTVVATPYYGPWPNKAETSSGEFHPILYEFEFAVDDAERIRCNPRTMAELERQIRLATFHPDQQATSDVIDFPHESDNPEHFEKKIKNARISGKRLAESAKKSAAFETHRRYRFPERSAIPESAQTESGKLAEVLSGLRTYDQPKGSVRISDEKIPVLGRYDVVVIGGGTSGVPAAIGAARAGAKTLLVEYLHDLGGVGTAGAISIYCFGYRDGFSKEVENGKWKWNIEQRSFWWRKALSDSGVDLWHGVLGTGVLLNENTVSGRNKAKGALLVTPQGPGIVLADMVIDSTGNADLAVAAGAQTRFAAEGRELAVQGAGLPPRDLGTSYTNTDYMFVDETDMRDATHVFVYARQRFPKSFDLAKMLDTRERRRIVPEKSFSVLDQINGRTYPDTIAHVYTNYDSHGRVSHRVLEFPYDYYSGHFSNVPYAASLPLGVDALLVSGLATGGDRDAMAVFRMQPDIQNQGYALGRIAAAAVKSGKSLREIDIRKIQEHLVEIGSLKKEVLQQGDNYETSCSELPEIVRNLPDDFEKVHRLLWHPEQSIPLLKKAYAESTEQEDKIKYATVLAALDDPSGADTLLEAVRDFEQWDSGPVWGVRNAIHGFSVSEKGRWVLALGRTKDPRAVDVIAQKMNMPGAGLHACVEALESIGGPRAAAVLAERLDRPKTTGFVRTDWKVSTEADRYKSVTEISLARALYRCGDTPDDKGRKILEAYTKDVRGVFSRHAVQVLAEKAVKK